MTLDYFIPLGCNVYVIKTSSHLKEPPLKCCLVFSLLVTQMVTWEMPKLGARRSCVVVKQTRNTIWVKIISFAQGIVPLCLLRTVRRSLWIHPVSHFSILSSQLTFTPWRENRGGIGCIKCAWFYQRVRTILGWEVLMYAWTAFICNAPSHSYSQLGKLVEQGANLATR